MFWMGWENFDLKRKYVLMSVKTRWKKVEIISWKIWKIWNHVNLNACDYI
jgi:hypothetical protein